MRIRKKQIFYLCLSAIFLSGCTATTGSGQASDPLSSALVGALAGALVGGAGCKIAGKNNCGKYIVGGAVVGAVTFYLLNEQQQRIYEAAEKNNMKTSLIEYEANGEKKAAILLEEHFFEDSDSSGEMTRIGKREFIKLVRGAETGGALNDVHYSVTYNGNSDLSHYQAEQRARELAKHLNSGSVGTVRTDSLPGSILVESAK